jgi:transcriptional regulator with XRE-family HTH domain
MYSTEDIARTIRQAREAKGLTQRALSEKTGLAQNHISRIETGSTDLQLSTLLELARALDMEMMLVPRNAVPAAQGLVRNLEATGRTSLDLGKSLRRLRSSIDRIASAYPSLKDVERLQRLSTAFMNLRLSTEQLQTIQDAARELRRVSQIAPRAKSSSIRDAKRERISQITNQLQNIRNTVVHPLEFGNQNRVAPAYSLDKGNNDG